MEAHNLQTAIPVEQRQKPTRRRLLNMMVSGSILGFFITALYPILRFLVPPREVETGTNSVLAASVGELKNNSGKVFPFGKKPAILIKTPDGDLRAFTAICTHLDCTVQYRSDFQHIWCACHNGHYDLTGRNIAGPPPRPLQQYQVKVLGDDIWVTKE